MLHEQNIDNHSNGDQTESQSPGVKWILQNEIMV